MQLYLKNDYPLFISYLVGNLGKMLVGLSPVDEKTMSRGQDYDNKYDSNYATKNVKVKNN